MQRRLTFLLLLLGPWVASAKYTHDLPSSPLISSVTFRQGGVSRLANTRTYDLLDRLTATTSTPSGAGEQAFRAAYTFDILSQRVGMTNADSSFWSWKYDLLGQVTNGVKSWADGTLAAGQQFGYAFDTIGNRTGTAVNGRPAGYQPNLLNRYTSREVPGKVDLSGTAHTNATVTLWGDNGSFSPTTRKGEYFHGELSVTNTAGSVWLSVTNLAVLQNGTNADYLTTVVGGTLVPKAQQGFHYDADGNLTNDGVWSYTWDAESRLVRMVSATAVGPQQRLDFGYDWQGRRVSKKVWDNTAGSGTPAADLKFVYDGWNLLAVLGPQSSVLQSFTWGLDLSGGFQGAGGVGGLVAMTVHTGTNAGTYFAAHDGNGNVLGLVNAADGTESARYEYGPFGELLRATGPLALANPFRFSTKYQDDETGISYYGLRYYRADLGRWLNTDLLEEAAGPNLYAFNFNSPGGYWDWLGLDPEASIGSPWYRRGGGWNPANWWVGMQSGIEDLVVAPQEAASNGRSYLANLHRVQDKGYANIADFNLHHQRNWQPTVGDGQELALAACGRAAGFAADLYVNVVPAIVVPAEHFATSGARNVMGAGFGKAVPMAAEGGARVATVATRPAAELADQAAARTLTKAATKADCVCAPAAKTILRVPEAGEDLFVGLYGQSRAANIQSGLNATHTPHHVVQDAVSGTSRYSGVTINLNKDLHALTRTLGRNADLGSNVLNLAADVRDLRNILRDAGYDRSLVNQQMQRLIELNRQVGNVPP